MLPWTNASLYQPPLYAKRKPPARSAVVPLEEARSSPLGWEARAKAQRIVTSSSSVRVGAAVPPKSGCLRYWKACGRVSQLRCMSLKKNLAALIDQFLFQAFLAITHQPSSPRRFFRPTLPQAPGRQAALASQGLKPRYGTRDEHGAYQLKRSGVIEDLNPQPDEDERHSDMAAAPNLSAKRAVADQPRVCLTPQTAMLVLPTVSSLWRSAEDDRMIAAKVGCREPQDP